LYSPNINCFFALVTINTAFPGPGHTEKGSKEAVFTKFWFIMKKNKFLLSLALLGCVPVWAEDLPKDTVRVIDVEEVVVIATPKESRKLRQQPSASTILSQRDMQNSQVTSLKGLSALVPNLFIPDYGSKLTSAIYIRGTGSRINNPSVGLYVAMYLLWTNRHSISTMPTLSELMYCGDLRLLFTAAAPWAG
jgi:hypothetical protein